ncbi:hypothetical protein [Geodermatophilus sp. SYSU D00696]
MSTSTGSTYDSSVWSRAGAAAPMGTVLGTGVPPQTGPPPPTGQPGSGPWRHLARTGLPVALGGLTGVLVALGLSGDALSRLVRNSPRATATAVVLAVLGVTIPVLAAVGQQFQRTAVLLGGVVLVTGAVVAVMGGASAIAEREEPGLTLTSRAVDPTGATVRIEVAARGSSLAIEEHVLVRVVAFRAGTAMDDARAACADTKDLTVQTTDDAGRPVAQPVLYSGESGPTTTGATSHTITLAVPTTYEYVCAHAALTDRSAGSDPRTATVIAAVAGLV